MTRRGKFIFAGCVLVHVVLSWFSYAYCAGVSMIILDSGGKQTPPSLIAMCWTHLLSSLPLLPLTRVVFGRIAASGLPELHPVYWVLVCINSFLAVCILYFVIRILRRLLICQSKLAHEKT
jgi:hypothetical protein